MAHEASRGAVSPHRLMLLVTIVEKGKGTFFSEHLKRFGANMQICVVGSGTVQSDLAEFLGLRDNRRSVIFSLVRAESVDAIFADLTEQFEAVNQGTGVSFAVPLSSVIGKLSYGFLSDERRIVKGEERDGN